MSDFCKKHNVEMQSHPAPAGRFVYCVWCMQEEIQRLEAELASFKKDHSDVVKQLYEAMEENGDLRQQVKKLEADLAGRILSAKCDSMELDALEDELKYATELLNSEREVSKHLRQRIAELMYKNSGNRKHL